MTKPLSTKKKSTKRKAWAPKDEATTEAKPETKAEPAKSDAGAAKPAEAPARGKGERIFASPLARRIAAEKGIDLAGLTGSGPKGRIVKADVEKAIAEGPRPAAKPEAAKGAAPAAQPLAVAVQHGLGLQAPPGVGERAWAGALATYLRGLRHLTCPLR